MEEFPVLSPRLQIGFFDRLKEAEKTLLLPSLLTKVGELKIARLDQELHRFVAEERLAALARKGLRGELIFAVPYVLAAKPTLLGYYRLLLGFSQKEFYKGPFSRFRNLEAKDQLTEATENLLPPLCFSLIESAWILMNGLPELTPDTITALTLLTLGPQLRGSRNVFLGAEAIRTVFALIKSIVSTHVVAETDTSLVTRNPVGREYLIEFSPDPDIVVKQILPDRSARNRIAIEIKGGKDFSNVHNRLGEAEKSHQKAKASGYSQFWTVVNVATLNERVWRRETPTTTEFFYLGEILDSTKPDYGRFKEYLISELGI